jgi:PAS domain S-box-containing protein
MSWSQIQQNGDVFDQMTILVGGAIRLLGGEAGVFVVANETFDPQSDTAYALYRLDATVLPTLLGSVQLREQPNASHLLVCEELPPELLALLAGLDEMEQGHEWQNEAGQSLERCSVFVYDQGGAVGVLHCLRPAGTCSCFEQADEAGGTLRLFIAELAAGLRSVLKALSLARAQDRLAAIFANSANGILTVDTALRIIDFNPAMEQLTGWRESEVMGRSYHEALHPRDRNGNDISVQHSPLMQAFAGQNVVNREMQIAARDGQRFTVLVSASVVRSAAGEPLSGILTVRDITREREEEERRSTFISVISHELQTPIAIIKGYASTLARAEAIGRGQAVAPTDTNALRSRLRAIEEEADRLNRLVNNLLYASRIQAGGLQMEIVPLDLAALIESVARRFRVRASDAQITLDLPPNLPTVMADRDRIEEVLQNLLDNAMKYSPRQRVVTVACSATGDEVITSVSDAGMGISLRDQEHIFDRFERASDRATQAMPGAGLGLYISRAIVEAHGGRIWVESTLHQGSTFFFSLPRVEKAQLPMVVF